MLAERIELTEVPERKDMLKASTIPLPHYVMALKALS